MAANLSISLTNSNGDAFKLDANQIIYAYDNSDSKAVLTYVSSTGVNAKPQTLTISTSALQALSTGILFISTVVDELGGTKDTCFNNQNVLTINDNTDTGSTMYYWVNDGSVSQKFVLNDAASVVSATTGKTFPATDSESNTVYYLNSLRCAEINAHAETGEVLESATVASRGTTMVAGTTTLTLSGGTYGTQATMLVTHTEVATATKTANGTGYTAGDVLTLATGTGTKATITVDTVTGGAITTFTLTTRGDYTVNPTLTNDTVTGGTGTGATFTLVMGAKTVAVANAGAYSAPPSNPVSTTGGGNNATLTATFVEGAVTGCAILYNDPSNSTFVRKDVQETAAQVQTLINAL